MSDKTEINKTIQSLALAIFVVLFAGCSGKQSDQIQKLANELTTPPVNSSGMCSSGENRVCTSGAGFGNQVCDASGSEFGACEISSCAPGYYLENAACLENVCSANSTTPCAVSNGVGEKTCNQLGSAFDQCQVTGCSAGFELSGAICVASVIVPPPVDPPPVDPPPPIVNVCTPGSVANCSELNGTGIKTCNAQGSGYGSCSLAECEENYYLYLGICVRPPIDHKKDCEEKEGNIHRRIQIDHHGIVHIPQWIKNCEKNSSDDSHDESDDRNEADDRNDND